MVGRTIACRIVCQLGRSENVVVLVTTQTDLDPNRPDTCIEHPVGFLGRGAGPNKSNNSKTSH